MTPLLSYRPLAALLLALAATACTQFPDLDGTVTPASEAAGYPALVPLEPLLATVDASNTDAQTTAGSINARVSRLKTRADRLRRGIVDPQTRSRMTTGVSAPQG